MSDYLVAIEGCDDKTAFFVQLTNAEVTFMDWLANLTKAAGGVAGSCRPGLRCVPVEDADADDLWVARERDKDEP